MSTERILGWCPIHLFRPLRRWWRRPKLEIGSRDGYNIACALRGPDYMGPGRDGLKVVFACRIRHLVRACTA